MTIEERIAQLKQQIKEKREKLSKKAKEARDMQSVPDMQACVDACKALQTDIDQLQSDLNTCEEAMGLDPDGSDSKAEDDGSSDEPDPPEKDSKRQKDPEGKIKTVRSIKTTPKDREVRDAVNRFLHSRGEKRDDLPAGITSPSVKEIIVPNQLLNLQIQPTNIVNLGGLINRVAVNSPSGTLPIYSRVRAGFMQKNELDKNPQVANPTLSQVSYTLETLSAFLTISQESIDDTALDLTAFVSNYIKDSKDQTEEKLIGAVLQTAQAVPAKGVDALKDVINKQIPIGYDKKIILTQSAYGELDKEKDGNGRYLLQDSIASASGKILFGLPVVVVNDDVLTPAAVEGQPVPSTLNLFIGDPKSFVLEAYKTDISLKFIDSYVWGTQIGAYFRANIVAADKDAGKFVTYSAE
ncbi:MAG: phage major capsid protein [Sporolactobacillus sp.]